MNATALGQYALTTDTVEDDGVVDYLYGDQHQDWFIAGTNDVTEAPPRR